MRFTKWMVIAVCAAVTTSCGENSTTESKTNSDTSTTAIERTDVNEPVNTSTSTSLNVPEPTRTAFTTKYPNAANVNWRRYEPVNTIDWDWTGWPKMDTSDYAVSYNADGSEYWAWYDQDNNWIGSVTTVTDVSTIPAAVTKTIQKEFPGYTVTSVDKENDKNRTAYEIDLTKGGEKAKLLVAEDGKLLKKKTGA